MVRPLQLPDWLTILVPFLFVIEIIVLVAVAFPSSLSSTSLANILLTILILTTVFTGVFTFLIEWWQRPKLEFVETNNLVITVKFQVGKRMVEKRVNVLTISFGNGGKSISQYPNVAFTLKEHSKEVWQKAIVLAREMGDADYIPIRTFEEAEGEAELAYALLKKGFRRIRGIVPWASQKFVVGFAFEGGKNFYFGLDFLFPIPLSGSRDFISVVARSINRFQTPFYSHKFLLSIISWDKLELDMISDKVEVAK